MGGLVEEGGEGEGEIEHEGGAAGVGLGEGESYAEGAALESGCERETRDEVAGVGAHVASGAVVIAQANVELVGWQQLYAECEVAKQVAHKGVFLHQSRGGGVFVLAVHVGELPAAQVGGSHRDAQWRRSEAFGEPHL